jgi:DHA2 family multidrug resistance protein
VDLRVLRHRSMIGGSLYSAILGMGLYGIMFAVPVFVQDYLHYTALQSGLILAPGAVASAIMMVLYGRIGGKLPPRLMIFAGALCTSLTGFLLMNINPNTGTGQLFWPLIARGFGSVMMFMPLSIATLGPLPKKDLAAGAGFYSLTRQLGSSIGIALITTIVVQRQALHRSVLVERISEFRPQFGERMQMLTGAFTPHAGSTQVAHDQALSVIDRVVSGQAMLQSYGDTFFYVAMLFIVTLPLLFLLGGKAGKDAAEAGSAAH